MKTSRFILFIFLSIVVTSLVSASIIKDIEKATRQGKVVFLVVTGGNSIETDKAIVIAKEASKKMKKSIALQMNRDDNANAELVSKYRLAGAPLPLIIVIAPNGIVTGGFPVDQATSDKLVSLVPSPKKADVLLAMNQGKAAFVVVGKKSMIKKKDILNNCAAACSSMGNKASVIEIDLDDAKEKKFLNELKVNQSSPEPQTYIINNQGQVAGTLSGIVDSKTLVATATKKASGGCCPSGSGKSCAPPKK